MTVLSDNIHNLRKEGKSYRDIVNILGCSIGTVAYHLGPGQKEKYKIINKRFKQKSHPYCKKIYVFCNKTKEKRTKNTTSKQSTTLILLKIHRFHRDPKDKKWRTCMQHLNFSTQDVIDKFGENPTCYLTGEPINIYEPRTYQFDHIIPRSKGGQNTLDNLAICTRRANMMKGDMTPDELVNMCKIIIDNYKSK